MMTPFEKEVHEIVTEDWLKAWDQETRLKSDAESHAIGCLIIESNRLKRETKELDHHYYNWKVMGQVAALFNFCICIFCYFQSPIVILIVWVLSLLALWTFFMANVAEYLNKKEFTKNESRP